MIPWIEHWRFSKLCSEFSVAWLQTYEWQCFVSDELEFIQLTSKSVMYRNAVNSPWCGYKQAMLFHNYFVYVGLAQAPPIMFLKFI